MLEAYFNDQEMMIIHRVHLEMERAKLGLENQRTYELVHDKEIIMIHDDSDSDGDGIEALRSNKLSISVFNPHLEAGLSSNEVNILDQTNGGVAFEYEQFPQPNICNNSPEDYYVGLPFELTNEENYVPVPQMSPVINDGIEFWEGDIRAEDDNDVKAEEKADEMNLDLDITMSQTFSQLQSTANTCVNDAAFSTDTTPILDEVNNDIEISVVASGDRSPVYENPVLSQGTIADDVLISIADKMPQISGSVELISAPNNLSTVGIITNTAFACDNLVINLDDTSSDESMDFGGF